MTLELVFIALITGGIVAIALKEQLLGGTLLGTALGQLGPSPIKPVGAK